MSVSLEKWSHKADNRHRIRIRIGGLFYTLYGATCVIEAVAAPPQEVAAVAAASRINSLHHKPTPSPVLPQSLDNE